ncbi:Isoprenylcysteine carboxyl methyltransferase (ICMT) family protein [Sporomusa ovata DSM 2662]|uniref:Alkylpyrone O-methyltransferase (B. subtilis BpsB) n=1 Tax=Sporomusa ovata TaxID=2378 RepID=A0A0U1L596_9FIRM|nr:isoprenylcysteine carboxylmethyltransferase family protein [Sporomusa ovata]EQB28528.1 isoprenylcysteine carboxyl methyltransferase [Sporomusa ovata DSM 2662]CQR74858.1 Alkylpyrone O-methyltransferase (B. subtilis BpsB) [Sporomusa ovata]
MVTGMIAGLASIIVIQRLTELLLANRNQIWILKKGGIEYGAGHYPLFFLLHTAWLVCWVTEGYFTSCLGFFWPVWLSLFLFAQVIRYWCIISLGHYWNTRILVIPGDLAVRRGPYRFLKHPNYLAVALELAVVPLIFGAVVASVVATAANAALLLLVRIPVEEQALNLRNHDM